MPQRTPADDGDDDILELTPDMEVEDDGPEDESEDEPEDEGAGEEEGAAGETDGEDDGPPQIGFGDDEPAEGDNSVIRGLRERNKQLARENQEMRSAQTAPPQLVLPPEPTLADCDYDEDKFKDAVRAYEHTKLKIEGAQADQRRQAEEANREWQRDIENLNSRRTALALPDYEDSANTVAAVLSLPQQAVIVKAAADSAAFIYALGRSDARLAELAKIQDPIKMAAAVARMEGGIKVVKKRKAPAPDRPASGGKPMPGGTDKQLAKLEDEAVRSGDRTAVIAYKKKLAKRGK